MASANSSHGGPVREQYPAVEYAEVQRPKPAPPPELPPNDKSNPTKRKRKPKKQRTAAYENNPPLVPQKSKELKSDIKTSGHSKRQDVSHIEAAATHIGEQGTTQANPLYDGVILLKEPGQTQRSPVYNADAKFFGSSPEGPYPSNYVVPPVAPPRACQKRTSAKSFAPPSQFVYDNIDHTKSRLSHEVSAPTGPDAEENNMFPIYEMAGALPPTYEDVPRPTKKQLPPQPKYSAPDGGPNQAIQPPPRVRQRQSPGTAEQTFNTDQPPTTSFRQRSMVHAQSEDATQNRNVKVNGEAGYSTDEQLYANHRQPQAKDNLYSELPPPNTSVKLRTQHSTEKPAIPLKPTPKPRQRAPKQTGAHHDPPRPRPRTPDQTGAHYDDPPRTRTPNQTREQNDNPQRTRRPFQRTPAICDSVYDEPIPRGSRQEPNPDYIYDEAAAVNAVQYHETKGNIPRSRPPVGSLDSVIVDKRFYNYICEFWMEELRPIQGSCDMDTTAVHDAGSNDIEVRFSRARTGSSCHELQERFIQLYQRLRDQLVIEVVDLTAIQDMSSYRNEIENKFKCLCFTVNATLEIVCLQTGIDPIRACTERHRSTRPPSRWPVGYDVAGAFNVYLYKADITKLHVDAITNAANEHLKHGGGVARAILEAAGDGLDKACKDLIKRKKKIPVSNVEKTVAGKLECRAVLHAVGPRWPKRNSEHEQNECRCLLLKTFENVMVTADKEGFKAVAIPPISSGIFGVPHEVVAQAMVDAFLNTAVKLNRPKLREVHVVDINDDVLPHLLSRLDNGGRLKAPTGQYVAVIRLPRAEVRVATVDETGYRRMLENTTIDRGTKQTFMNKVLCGGGGSGNKNRRR